MLPEGDSLSPIKEPSNECEKPVVDHHWESHERLQEHMRHTQDQLSQLLPDTIVDLIGQIYQSKLESHQRRQTISMLQQQLQVLIDQDEEDLLTEPSTPPSELQFDLHHSMENEIERLRKDIKELEVVLKDVNNCSQTNASQEQVDINSRAETTKSLNKTSHMQPTIAIPEQINETIILLPSSLERVSLSNSDLSEIEPVLPPTNGEMYLEDDAGEEEESDSYVMSRISQKIQLSNNIIRWLRGPVKIAFNSTMHVFDFFAQGTHISSAALLAVQRGYEKQKSLSLSQSTNNNSLKPAFAEINSEWMFISENLDRGFNSPSIWMHDPRGQRILVKTQEHPLCAANEWLVYTLGKVLGLPVNEVQISVYQNNLVTLHTDIAHDNEKTITFMDLPRQTRKILITDAVMGCMDLLDHIVQNVDRNQRNILITMPKTTTINDDTGKMKIHLIDHASCFGMGKLSVISLIACKFHTNHLSVVKFDPIVEARKFEHYLSRLPIVDRRIIRRILNRFAAITNDQFNSWMSEIQDLLSPSQCNRIRDVLYRQRDIAKHFVIDWGFRPVKVNETNSIPFEMVTHF